MAQSCPLCHHPHPRAFHHDAHCAYLQCPVCMLIFVAREDLLSPQGEKARYDLHENHPNNPGYRQFLGQLAQPLLQRLDPPPLKGLDFGSGPGPTLSIMLEEQGYEMTLYDPFYAPQTEALESTYDFVTCTETVEHFHNPGREWDLLIGLVKPGGWLGIMTQLVDDLEAFPKMHYINDRTHVSFFSRYTFQFLSQRDGLPVEFIGDNVVLIHKPLDWQRPGEVGDETQP